MREKLNDGTKKYRADQDHPRVCGKNLRIWLSCAFHAGSPPRMREKHGEATNQIALARITPAYAGKTKLLKFTLIAP